MPGTLLLLLLAGVGTLAGFVDAELRNWLSKQSRYPWVSIDEPAPHSVICSSDKGVAEAVYRLASLGHKRIAFWGGPTCFNTHRLELEGFRVEAVSTAGTDSSFRTAATPST